ncbi:UNVERIFIED_CONTAM: hypothetical protein K2H54_059769 [Gekko kuhli]
MATSLGQHLPKVEILHSAIFHIKGLQHLLCPHCCHPPMPSGSKPASPTTSCFDSSSSAAACQEYDTDRGDYKSLRPQGKRLENQMVFTPVLSDQSQVFTRDSCPVKVYAVLYR